MRRALLLVLLVPLVPVLVAPSPAFACSCVMFTPHQYVNNADLVVAGTLTEVEYAPPNSEGIISSGDPTKYSVGVVAGYKGTSPEELSFTSARDGASCGVEGLLVGREYVFFLDEVDGAYSANLCNGTARVPEARVAKITGRSSPLPASDPVVIDSAEPAQNAYPLLLPALGAGALVALGIGFVLWRRGARA